MNIFDKIEKMSYDIADKIGKGDSEEDIELYRYSIFMIFSELFSFGTGLILAILFRCTVPYLIVNVVFAVLRSGAGGFHCETFKSCFFTSTILFFISCFMSILFLDYYYYTCIISAYAGVFMIPYCPVPSKNSPTRGRKEDIRFRCKYRTWLLILVSISAISAHFGLYLISSSISFSILSVVFIISKPGEWLTKKVSNLFAK